MYAPDGVKTNANMPVPDSMRAWVLGDPGELRFTQKPVPIPRREIGRASCRERV